MTIDSARLLDDVDLRILVELQRNGRLSNKTLAGRVGLSPSACLARVRKLKQMGALSACVATIGRAMFDRLFEGWAMLTLSNKVPSAMTLLAKTLVGAEIVVEAYELAGGCDVLVHIVAADLREWRRLERIVEKNTGTLADVRIGVAIRVIKPPSPWPIERLLGRRRRHTKDNQR